MRLFSFQTKLCISATPFLDARLASAYLKGCVQSVLISGPFNPIVIQLGAIDPILLCQRPKTQCQFNFSILISNS